MSGRDRPIEATRRRQPTGRRLAACSGLSRKSRGATAGGRAAVARAIAMRSARRAAQSPQSAIRAAARSRSLPARSPAASEATSSGSCWAWKSETWGMSVRRASASGGSLATEQVHSASSSLSRNASRPRWMRDLTVPSETPVIVGDLGVVIALDVEEDDRRPLVHGDRREGLVEGVRPLERRAVWPGSASSAAGGCQLSSSSSGYGWTGRRLRARWMSIAALTAMRLSHVLTLPPRNPARLR